MNEQSAGLDVRATGAKQSDGYGYTNVDSSGNRSFLDLRRSKRSSRTAAKSEDAREPVTVND